MSTADDSESAAGAGLLLSAVAAGDRVRVKAVHAGRGLQSRLASMGLIPGVELEIIRNTSGGPFVVGIKETRLMLGRGMAHRIEVS